jgi:predicted transcriptional regulator
MEACGVLVLMSEPNDWIRDSVANAAESQGLTAYAIAKLLNGSPTEETVKRYIAKRCHLGTQHVSKICDVLGLDLRVRKRK